MALFNKYFEYHLTYVLGERNELRLLHSRNLKNLNDDMNKLAASNFCLFYYFIVYLFFTFNILVQQSGAQIEDRRYWKKEEGRSVRRPGGVCEEAPGVMGCRGNGVCGSQSGEGCVKQKNQTKDAFYVDLSTPQIYSNMDESIIKRSRKYCQKKHVRVKSVFCIG